VGGFGRRGTLAVMKAGATKPGMKSKKTGMKSKKKAMSTEECPEASEETGLNNNTEEPHAPENAKPRIPKKTRKKARKGAHNTQLQEERREAKMKKAAVAKEIEEDAQDELPPETLAEETVAQEKKTKANRFAEEPQEAKEPRGVVHIAHIPNGFHEKEMTEFFNQFGNVTRIRLARSKKNSVVKGYGWIEFEDLAVAQIVAEAMDNYLLGGRQLVVKLVPPEAVHRQLFSGWKIPRINQTPKRLKEHRDLVNDRPQVEVDGELLPQWTTDQIRRLKEKAEKLKAALETLSISYDIDGAINGGGQSDDEIIVPVSSEELHQNISTPRSARLPEAERPKTFRFQQKQKRKARFEPVANSTGGSEGAPVTAGSTTGPGHIEHGSVHTVRKVRRKDYHQC